MDADDPGLEAEPGRLPALRASDQDRDEALRLLAAAVGDGRLTLEEYSGRADRALGARMRSELGDVTADLQEATVQSASEVPDKLVAILGTQSRRGRWRVPPHLTLRSLLGDCTIELQDAILTSPATTIEAHALLGSVTISVPEGVEVRLFGTAILGESSSALTRMPVPGAPIINVWARVILGQVAIRAARPALAVEGGAAPQLRGPSEQS
jgi:hypothetical protein